MNIKNFITSILSSGFKKKQQQQKIENKSNNQLINKSETMNQEEDLLANLRKSKLFQDDSDMGLSSKIQPPNQNKEDQSSQALLDAEKIVGVMHQSSKKSGVNKGMECESKKSNSGIAKYVQEVKQELSAKKQQDCQSNVVLYKVNDFSDDNVSGKQNSHLQQQQQLFSDMNKTENSKNIGFSCEINDPHQNFNNQQLNYIKSNNQQNNQNQLNHSLFTNQQQNSKLNNSKQNNSKLNNSKLNNSKINNSKLSYQMLNNQMMNQYPVIQKQVNDSTINNIPSNNFIRSNIGNSQNQQERNFIENQALPCINNNSSDQINNQYYPKVQQNIKINQQLSQVQQINELHQQQSFIQQNMQQNQLPLQVQQNVQSSQPKSNQSFLQSEFQTESQVQEVDLTNCLLKSPSQIDRQQSFNQTLHPELQSMKRSSSTSSRTRGSSSKKKSIVSDNPTTTNVKKDFSFEKYPTLGQIRENIQCINSYQPLVKEDIEGENEGQVQAVIDQNIENMNKMMEEEDGEKMQILNLSAFTKKNNEQQLQSSQKQLEYLSTKAEPATNIKQRSNSFFSEQSIEKKKLFNIDDINSKKSNISSYSINNDSSDKRMSIESSYSKMSQNKQNSNCMEPEIQPKTSGFESRIQTDENQNNENYENTVNSFFNNKENFDNKCLSDQKISSNGSSPSRINLSGFQKHKKIDMMIDKSEIPPPHQTRSAHKVPSPIKEVEEHSQRNNKFTPKKNGMEIMENQKEIQGFECEKEENSNQTGSPKMRQKSVKFDEDLFTPIQNHNSNNINSNNDDEELKHQKLQSRKPTPYNHEKQFPKSYLSRQNKFKAEDSSSQSSCKDIVDSNPSTQTNLHGQTEEIITAPINTESNNSEEVSSQQLPILNQADTKNDNNINETTKEKSSVLSNKYQTQKKETSLNTTQKKTNGLSIPRIPINNNSSQQKTGKQPIVLKSKEKNSNFFKNEINHSTPILVSNTHASSTTNSSSGQTTNIKNNFKAPLNKINGLKTQNNKRKPNADEQALLSNFTSTQKIKTTQESSIPPASRQIPQIRGTMLNGSTPALQLKSVFKVCMYCQNDIKLKEEVKTFTCCHKAHMACLPKEKNLKCVKCNSSNQINKK